MNFTQTPDAVQKFNSYNLYVTTSQIIIMSKLNDPNSWVDLYTLWPYLRNSLVCVVCLNLVVDPLTPETASCQHHLCRRCEGKPYQLKLKCKECTGCNNYKENKRLRMLLRCYKQMCLTLTKSPLFKRIEMQASRSRTKFNRSAKYTMSLVEEGALFQDNCKRKKTLKKKSAKPRA